MMTTSSDQLLRNFNLRNTPTRSEILDLFLKTNFALAQGDIEKAVDQTFDRVTVYRTLKTFLDKGLVHKVLDDEGGVKYALCSEACSSSHHRHDHVHFKCSRCQQTICLNIDVPPVKLPKGYSAHETNLLVQGICDQCR